MVQVLVGIRRGCFFLFIFNFGDLFILFCSFNCYLCVDDFIFRFLVSFFFEFYIGLYSFFLNFYIYLLFSIVLRGYLYGYFYMCIYMGIYSFIWVFNRYFKCIYLIRYVLNFFFCSWGVGDICGWFLCLFFCNRILYAFGKFCKFYLQNFQNLVIFFFLYCF